MDVLIFDFDGTIADTLDLLVQALDSLAKKHRFKKLSATTTVAEMQQLSNKQWLERLNIAHWKLPFLIRDIRRYLRDNLPQILPFKDLLPVLEILKQDNRKLLIVTTNTRKNVRNFFKIHNITQFDAVYCVARYRGKKGILKKLAGRYRGSCIYIGDEVRDIRAARAAGIRAGAVSWGYHSEQILKANHPDYFFVTPGDLIRLSDSVEQHT